MYNVYTPREAADLLSTKLGVKMSYRKYYKLLKYFGIIDEFHLVQAPYNDSTLFFSQYQPILNHKRSLLINGNHKVFVTDKGIDIFIELFMEYV